MLLPKKSFYVVKLHNFDIFITFSTAYLRFPWNYLIPLSLIFYLRVPLKQFLFNNVVWVTWMGEEVFFFMFVWGNFALNNNDIRVCVFLLGYLDSFFLRWIKIDCFIVFTFIWRKKAMLFDHLWNFTRCPIICQWRVRAIKSEMVRVFILADRAKVFGVFIVAFLHFAHGFYIEISTK